MEDLLGDTDLDLQDVENYWSVFYFTFCTNYIYVILRSFLYYFVVG